MVGLSFLDLSAEIRNMVYKFHLESYQMNDDVDICCAAQDAPGKNILLANKQVHHEVRPMYRHAVQRFWSSTRFLLNLGEAVFDVPQLELVGGRAMNHIKTINSMDNEAFERICRIEIKALVEKNRAVTVSFRFNLLDPSGLWEREIGSSIVNYENPRSSYLVFSHDPPEICRDFDAEDQAKAQLNITKPRHPLKTQVLTILWIFGKYYRDGHDSDA